MDFHQNIPIYIQIENLIKQKILNKEWQAGERLLSIRVIASNLKVNPNTVLKVFTNLQMQGLIYNKRGIGYFVEKNAFEKIEANKKVFFMNEKMSEFIKEMKQLNISLEKFVERYNKINNL